MLLWFLALYGTGRAMTEFFRGDFDHHLFVGPLTLSQLICLLAAVILFLKESGYENITIGEGTNSGFYRNNISVITRLRVDALAEYYGVNCIDLNSSESVSIPFEDGVQAGIARECVEADFFINMPKLKTHFEAGMTVCLKNLIGCLVGQDNKKKNPPLSGPKH